MKIFCEITIGRPDLDGYLAHSRLETEGYLEHTRFGQLVKLCPEAKSGSLFRTHLPVDDLRIQQIVDFLRSLGKEPKTSYVGALKPNQFQMLYWREYEQADYETTEFLQPEPEVSFYVTSLRLENGMLRVGTNDLRKRFALASGYHGLVVSEEARQQMVEAKLIGLVFKPLVIIGRKADQWEGKAWELTTDVVLPPLAPCCRLVDVHGRPFTGNLEDGLALDGSPYAFAEKHYLRSAISRMPPFDLARTHEVFGYRKGWSSSLVASQRFYTYCVKQKIPMKWVPVRINED